MIAWLPRKIMWKSALFEAGFLV